MTTSVVEIDSIASQALQEVNTWSAGYTHTLAWHEQDALEGAIQHLVDHDLPVLGDYWYGTQRLLRATTHHPTMRSIALEHAARRALLYLGMYPNTDQESKAARHIRIVITEIDLKAAQARITDLQAELEQYERDADAFSTMLTFWKSKAPVAVDRDLADFVAQLDAQATQRIGRPFNLGLSLKLDDVICRMEAAQPGSLQWRFWRFAKRVLELWIFAL